MLLKLAIFLVGLIEYVSVLLLMGVVWSLIKLWLERFDKVQRGAKIRDRRIMEAIAPIGSKLDQRTATQADTEPYAAKPELRLGMYRVLEETDQLSLFPENLLTVEAQAEADLAYWLMHPNEMGDAPQEIVLLEKIQRMLGTDSCDFYVFQFQHPDQSLYLGVSGPYRAGEEPYESRATSFSRFKKNEMPAELVDWFVKVRRDKKVSL